jgi:hypothetical protein
VGGPGRVVWSRFDNELGGAWKIDMTAAYPGASLVERLVVHLLPGIVAVVDTAVMPQEARFSLRWHTVRKPEIFQDNSFIVKGDRAVVIGQMTALPGSAMEQSMKHHQYHPPYDRDRLGDPLEQRREPYYEATTTAEKAQWMTVFATGQAISPLPTWENKDTGCHISWDDQEWFVAFSEKGLVVSQHNSNRSLVAPL